MTWQPTGQKHTQQNQSRKSKKALNTATHTWDDRKGVCSRDNLAKVSSELWECIYWQSDWRLQTGVAEGTLTGSEQANKAETRLQNKSRNAWIHWTAFFFCRAMQDAHVEFWDAVNVQWDVVHFNLLVGSGGVKNITFRATVTITITFFFFLKCCVHRNCHTLKAFLVWTCL